MRNRLLAMLIVLPSLAAAKPHTDVREYVMQEGDAQASGDCPQRSVAANRPDAWRCAVGNEIHDPCFADGLGKTYVVCPADLEKKTALRINLSKPITFKSFRVWQHPRLPFAMRIKKGVVCKPETGSAMAGTEHVLYRCTDGDAIVKVDRGDVWWKAEKVKVAPGGAAKSKHAVNIEVVWL